MFKVTSRFGSAADATPVVIDFFTNNGDKEAVLSKIETENGNLRVTAWKFVGKYESEEDHQEAKYRWKMEISGVDASAIQKEGGLLFDGKKIPIRIIKEQ